MATDPSVQVAIVSGIAGIVSTLGVIAVAFINNRRERTGAAEKGVELTLRERITLRDEQIVDLKGDIAERDQIIEDRNETIAQKSEENTELRRSNSNLRADLRAAKEELSKLKGSSKGKHRE